MMPIIGKKTVLFEIEPLEIASFAEAHRDDKRGYLQTMSMAKMTQEEAEGYTRLMLESLRIVAFTVMTKEGTASRRAGYVYITSMTDHGCQIGGLMLKEFAVGLSRQVRRGKYTFSQDAYVTMIDWIFKSFPKYNRIEVNVVESNRHSAALTEHVGFKKEGVLREYLHIDDRTEDVAVYSILRREWENHGEKQTADAKHTGV